MEIIKSNGKYRITKGIGQNWNLRYEVQEKYKYYENGWIYNWHMVFHSIELENCIEVYNKRIKTC